MPVTGEFGSGVERTLVSRDDIISSMTRAVIFKARRVLEAEAKPQPKEQKRQQRPQRNQAVAAVGGSEGVLAVPAIL